MIEATCGMLTADVSAILKCANNVVAEMPAWFLRLYLDEVPGYSVTIGFGTVTLSTPEGEICGGVGEVFVCDGVIVKIDHSQRAVA